MAPGGKMESTAQLSQMKEGSDTEWFAYYKQLIFSGGLVV